MYGRKKYTAKASTTSGDKRREWEFFECTPLFFRARRERNEFAAGPAHELRE